MDANASALCAAGLGGDSHVDWPIERPQKAPVNSGGPVAQRSPVATSEHCPHPPRFFTQSLVAHRIDTAVKTMETAALGSLCNRALRQPHFDELPRRHDPMLLARDAGDAHVNRGVLVNHEDTKSPRAFDSPP